MILAHDLDIINELKDLARIRIVALQQRTTKSYNKNFKVRRFQIGNLVLRNTFQNTKDPNAGKLASK